MADDVPSGAHEPRLELSQMVIDCADPQTLGRWWAAALGWDVVEDDPDEFEIRASSDRLPGILFERVAEGFSPETRADGRRVKRNRLHLDFRPDDQDAEVRRLERLGAHRIDIGQGDVTWVVMEDPEHNEFCVLSSRTAGTP